MAPETASPPRPVITLRDSTLREGQDVAGVRFSPAQKLRIARMLEEANVPEIEVVAPGRVLADLPFVATHTSAGHLEIPELFEAFDPALVGARRAIDG